VTISFNEIPPACAPDRIRITVDVNDDPLPPAALVYPASKVEEPFEMTLPARVVDADVISASSIDTRARTMSDSQRVLITSSR
jgi:hypothetical protein